MTSRVNMRLKTSEYELSPRSVGGERNFSAHRVSVYARWPGVCNIPSRRTLKSRNKRGGEEMNRDKIGDGGCFRRLSLERLRLPRLTAFG